MNGDAHGRIKNGTVAPPLVVPLVGEIAPSCAGVAGWAIRKIKMGQVRWQGVTNAFHESTESNRQSYPAHCPGAA